MSVTCILISVVCLSWRFLVISAEEACSNTNPCVDFKVGEPLQKCEYITSKNGYLDFTLTVDVTEHRFDWLRYWNRAYNGKTCPPTWRIRKGDEIHLKLVNKLGPNTEKEHKLNTLGIPNTTNIHVHGLHISQLIISPLIMAVKEKIKRVDVFPVVQRDYLQSPHDNVFVHVEPGESFQYQYDIEKDHPSGTFFYHAHVHGSGTLQCIKNNALGFHVGKAHSPNLLWITDMFINGLAGIIIIEDDPIHTPNELMEVSCPYNCQHDIPIIFSSLLQANKSVSVKKLSGDNIRYNDVDIGNGENLEDWLAANVNYITVNGQLKPTLEIERGQMKRFRVIKKLILLNGVAPLLFSGVFSMLNAGILDSLELELVSENKKSKCEIREIALDGVFLDRPRRLKIDQSFLSVGNRIDWLIRCDEPGTYKLLSTPKTISTLSTGENVRHSGELLTIKVTEVHNVWEWTNFPRRLPVRPEYANDLRNAKVDQTIVIELTDDQRLNREKWAGETDYRYKLEVDSIVEIQLISTDASFSHPMHFHAHHFQVISYEPYRGPWSLGEFMIPLWDLHRQEDNELCFFQYPDYKGLRPNITFKNPLRFLGHDKRWRADGDNTLAYACAGDWKDTIHMPGLANITLRMKVHKFVGPLLVHCHLPEDSDLGMMLVLDVVEKGGDLSGARISSEGIFPGSCDYCKWNLFKDVPDACLSDDDEQPEYDQSLYGYMKYVFGI